MTSGVSDPYRQFLATADVAGWRSCLDAVAAAVFESGDSEDGNDRLAEAITISAYVVWLGTTSGDLDCEEVGRQRHDELRAELDRRSHGPLSPRLEYCWGIELAWTGYGAMARERLEGNGRLSPEHLLMVLPAREVRQVKELRPLFTGAETCRFLPAVHDYGAALVGVGAVYEARDLVTSGEWDPDDPLLLDVLGTTHERLGQWSEAVDAYRNSTWPIHRFRAAMIGAISDAGTQASDGLELDEPTRRVIAAFGNELDQAELTRCIGFLNACMWNPVDDWVVERELASLSFRRRRFAEAELHLSRSLRAAPKGATFPLAHLRFINLTWLTDGFGSGEDVGAQIDMTPEAIEAGYAAITCADPTDETADIRTWVAGVANDLSLIPSSLDEWAPYDRAEAYETIGDTSQLIDPSIEALETSYDHRVVKRLMRVFGDAGLQSAAAYLAELVLRESYDDFFALWETAELVVTSVAYDETEPDRGLTLIDRFARRLRELSEFEFKNTVRSYGFFRRAGRSDIAEEMLVDATRLAEGVSELLAVAVLRRKAGGARIGRVDQEGLACLTRAMAEARDRVERLQVARELFFFGRIREGRSIVEAEGVVGGDGRLSPVEYVAALQCAAWLSGDERADLAHAAASQLDFEYRSGTLGGHPVHFADRLVATISAVDPRLAAEIQGALAPPLREESPAREWPGAKEGDWPSVSGRIDDLLTADDDAALAAIVEDSSLRLGLLLAVVDRFRRLLDALIDEARTVRPTVPPENTPISKYDPRLDGPRTIELCDLWRARLADPERTDEPTVALEEFYAQEAEIEGLWEDERRVAGGDTARRIARVLDLLEAALGWLAAAANPEHVNPVIAGMFRCILTDSETLLGEVAERRARTQLDLAPVADGDAAGSTT